jgi:hypothetical protein
MPDYLDVLLNEIKSDIGNKQNKKLVYNPKTKHISVTYDFASGWITNIKLKTDCKTWLEYFYRLDFDNVCFQDIECLLSRTPKQKIQLLQQYSIDDPCGFSTDVLKVFMVMLDENRAYKPRKKERGSWYGLNRGEKAEIQAQAANLYVFLGRMSHLRKWPTYFEQVCEKCGIERYEIKADRPNAVRKIMSTCTGLKFSERFFQTFVSESPLKLSVVRKSPNKFPNTNPFLKSIFNKILS